MQFHPNIKGHGLVVVCLDKLECDRDPLTREQICACQEISKTVDALTDCFERWQSLDSDLWLLQHLNSYQNWVIIVSKFEWTASEWATNFCSDFCVMSHGFDQPHSWSAAPCTGVWYLVLQRWDCSDFLGNGRSKESWERPLAKDSLVRCLCATSRGTKAAGHCAVARNSHAVNRMTRKKLCCSVHISEFPKDTRSDWASTIITTYRSTASIHNCTQTLVINCVLAFKRTNM